MNLAMRLGWSLFNAFQLLFTLGWSVLWISLGVVVASCGWRRGTHWLARHVWAPGLVYGALARIEVRGEVPGAGPWFVAVNHQSVIDIPAAMMALPMPVHFIVKQELARVPFLGWYVRAMGMVFVHRTRLRAGFRQLKAAHQLLAQGHSILCFAEGTRSRSGEIFPFRSGSFLVAIETGTPVLPVYIHDARKILPPGGFRVRPGRIVVCIGQPITTAGRAEKDRGQVAAEAWQAVRALQACAQD